jgi:toxin CptA
MKPIQIDFKPSISLTLIISTMGLGASVILILPALLWQLKSLLGIGIFASATYAVCQYGLLVLPWSCVALNVDSYNQLTLVLRNGDQLQVQLCPDSVVTPYLTVVHYQVKNMPFLRRLAAAHLVILPDMLDAESYRQLRVWLRWGKSDNT